MYSSTTAVPQKPRTVQKIKSNKNKENTSFPVMIAMKFKRSYLLYARGGYMTRG